MQNEPVESELVEKQQPVDIEKALRIITGSFEPDQENEFVKIDIKYADREGLFLAEEAYKAFVSMHTAASKEGIQLIIKSATRNFNYQKGIWERKWNGETKIEEGTNAKIAYPNSRIRALKILEYSSMPGTSRHHWGTDIDLNNFENEWFESGEGLRIYNWLTKHAGEYGFCQVYTAKGNQRPEGYNEEKWHWSYLPLAQKYTNIAKEHLTDEMIKSFQGAEVATDIGVVNKYVLGINPLCK